MGLRSELQTDIAEAFDTDLFDAVSYLTLNVKTNAVYNPTTGLNTPAVNSTSIRGVLDQYNTLERFNTFIEPTDVKFIVLQNELLDEPKIKDEVVDGIFTYYIIQIEKDPANATMVLHLRRS